MTNIKFFGLITGFIVVSLSFSSCYYDVEENLYPGGCDTSGVVSYNLNVKPIIEQHCTVCHSQAAAPTSGSGIVLDNYDDLKAFADAGILMGAIEWTSGKDMPKGGQKLDQCTISSIQKWIQTGYLP